MPVYETHRVGRTDVVLCPMNQVESVSVGLWFRVGSRYEPAMLNGAAHFIEHLLFKGTKKRNSLKISEEIESRGGDLNAFTSEESTCYYARAQDKDLPRVLDVLFDMLWHSTFPADEVERERGVIQEEIRMYDDQPSSLVGERLNLLLWPESPLGRQVGGTEDTVRIMKRKDMMQFWRSYYRPSTLVVSIAGNIETKEVLQLLKPYLEVKRNTRAGSPWKPVSIKRRRSLEVESVVRPIHQANLALGAYSVGRSDKRRYAHKLLSIIMGENMSSRLWQVLRERHGMAYSVHTNMGHFRDTGAFYLNTGLDPENVEACVSLIAKELTKVRNKNVSAAELRRAKDYAIGQMKLALESTTNQMYWIGETQACLGRVPNPDEIVSNLNAVTSDEIRKAACDLFQPGMMKLCCVGPSFTSDELKSRVAMLNHL